jgi:hypothetical protein
MKKFLSLGVFILTLGLLTFVACKKEDVNTITANDNPVLSKKQTLATTTNLEPQGIPPVLSQAEVVDGRLKFNSQDEFQEAVDILLASKKNLQGVEDQFTGFVSQQQAFANLTEASLVESGGAIEPYSTFAAIVEDEEGEKYLEPVVDSKLLRYIVNQDGLLQIGENIYKFNRDEVFVFDSGLLPEYQKYKNRLKGAKLNGFKMEKIERNHSDSKERWVVVHAATSYTATSSSTSRKISTQIEQITVPVLNFQESRGQVRNLFKGFLGIWYRTDATSMSISGSINSNVLRGFIQSIETVAIADDCSNCGEISEPATFASIWTISALTTLGGVVTGTVLPKMLRYKSVQR